MLVPSPKVSVLLPSYQHELWIREAIDSVLKQTYSHLELIIVDDGSKDNSPKIIKKCANQDSRIRYRLLTHNIGAASAMLTALEMSEGELISYISSDDIWDLDKLKKQINLLNIRPELSAVFSLPKIINKEGEDINHRLSTLFQPSLEIHNREKWLNFFFRRGNCICHPTMLIRRECFEKEGGYNPALRSLPDFDMWVRLFYKYDIYVMDEQLVKFRVHDYNESGYSPANVIRGQSEKIEIYKHFLKLLKSVDTLKAVFPEYQDLFLVPDIRLTRLYLGLLSIKQKSKPHWAFGISLLYEEMGKPEIAALAVKNGIYTYSQLGKDAGRLDIYSVGNYYSRRSTLMRFLIIKFSKIITHLSSLR